MKLKIVVIIFIAMFCSVDSHAQNATVIKSRLACYSESDYVDITKFSMAEDVESVQAYIDQNKCFFLKKGIPSYHEGMPFFYLSSLLNLAPLRDRSPIRPFTSKTYATTASLATAARPPPPFVIRATLP